MTTGMVFDIKEFAVHDGPGIRLSVFLKGCPLSCRWCHNPEGLSPKPQEVHGPSGTRLVGEEISAADLAARIMRQADVLRHAGGGVTFTGGEPLAQAAFVLDVIERLDGVHVLIDTSGYAPAAEFDRVISRADRVFFDLKLLDPDLHRKYTGVDNETILHNLDSMKRLGVPFVARIPLVPGVTDTESNLSGWAERICPFPNLVRVDLLPYNRAAGAKYAACGMDWNPGFDEERAPDCNVSAFKAIRDKVRVV